MYGIIQLSDVVFGKHVGSLYSAKNSLSDVSKPSLDISLDSKALSLYQEQFYELYELVTSYIALLETDIGLINMTRNELVETDNVLGKNFK